MKVYQIKLRTKREELIFPIPARNSFDALLSVIEIAHKMGERVFVCTVIA